MKSTIIRIIRIGITLQFRLLRWAGYMTPMSIERYIYSVSVEKI